MPSQFTVLRLSWPVDKCIYELQTNLSRSNSHPITLPIKLIQQVFLKATLLKPT